jgi:hypothetical protein
LFDEDHPALLENDSEADDKMSKSLLLTVLKKLGALVVDWLAPDLHAAEWSATRTRDRVS